MGDIIRQPDVYDINLYKPLIKDTETLITLYEKLGTLFTEDAKALMKAVDQIDPTCSGINKPTKNYRECKRNKPLWQRIPC